MAHQKTKLFVASSIQIVKTAVVVWTGVVIGGVVLAVAIASSSAQATGTISFSKASINAGGSVDITVNATAPTGSKITSITVNTGDPEDSKKYTKGCSARTCKYTFTKKYNTSMAYNVSASVISQSTSGSNSSKKALITREISKTFSVTKGVEPLSVLYRQVLVTLSKTSNITTDDWIDATVDAHIEEQGTLGMYAIELEYLNTSDVVFECPNKSAVFCNDMYYYSDEEPYFNCAKANGGYYATCTAKFRFKFKSPGTYAFQAEGETMAFNLKEGPEYFSKDIIVNVGATTNPTTPDDDTVPPITEPPKPVPPSVSISATKSDPVCTSVGCKQSVTIIVTTTAGDNPISSISISDGSSSWSNLSFSKEYDINPNGTPTFKSFQAVVTDDQGLSGTASFPLTLMVPKDPIGTLTFTSSNPMTLGGTVAIVAKLNNKDAKVNLELVHGSGNESLLKPTLLETRNCKSNGDKTCITTPPWNIATYGDKPNPSDQTYTFKATFTTNDGKSTTATAKLTIKKKELSCPYSF